MDLQAARRRPAALRQAALAAGANMRRLASSCEKLGGTSSAYSIVTKRCVLVCQVLMKLVLTIVCRTLPLLRTNDPSLAELWLYVAPLNSKSLRLGTVIHDYGILTLESNERDNAFTGKCSFEPR